MNKKLQNWPIFVNFSEFQSFFSVCTGDISGGSSGSEFTNDKARANARQTCFINCRGN